VISQIKNIIKFLDDDILYFAGSLSFFTILTLLPIIALMMVLVSSLPIFNEQLDHLILFALDFVNPTHSETLVQTITKFLTNASGVGTIGIIYLLFSFTIFFRDYDLIVNRIYGISSKSFIKMFFSYLALLLILPILFALYTISVASISLAFLDNDTIQTLLTFLVNWISFIILFKISINTQVQYKAIAMSTFATLLVLSIIKILFLYYTIYNHMYTTIYGSFSVFMLLFVWLYISWLVYLFGIKLSKILNEKLSQNSIKSHKL
jgi:membrane protein